MEFSKTEIEAHAREIILDHARDIEELSISEMLEHLDLSLEEHEDMCRLVSGLISLANIEITWDK